MELNRKIKEELQNESNELKDEVEYSCTIDKCSEALALHMSKHRLDIQLNYHLYSNFKLTMEYLFYPS